MDAGSAQSLLDLAERSGPGLRGLESKALFQQLEQQYAELGAALQWFIDQGRTDEAIRLATCLAPFWMATKRLEDGSTWFDRSLQLPGGDDAVRGRACFEAGLLVFWKGEDERASAFHLQALEIGRRSGNPTVIALGLTGLARIALRSNVVEAQRLCREALAVTEGTADRLGRSSAIHVLGVAAQMSGEFLEARTFMDERIAISRELRNYAAVSLEASNLSMVERQLGNLERADELAREALEIFKQREDEWAFPYGLNSLAAVATDRGELERAATIIGAAEAMMKAQGAAWPPDERAHYDRTVAALAGAMGSAEFDRVRAAGRAMSSSEAIDFALGASRAG